MAKLTFTIETDDTGEMAGLMGRLFGGATPAQQAHPIASDDPETTEAGEAPKRRGRRSNAQIEADNAAAAAAEQGSVSTASPTPEPTAQPTATAVTAEPVTLEMVKAAGTEVLNKKDMAAVVAILAPFGAKRFADVKPEDMAAVHAKLVEAAK